ncbi:MAG: hypothetical protein ACM3Q2_17020 [Syntrophothermus sp.]
MKYLIGILLLLAVSLCSCSAERSSQKDSESTLLSHNVTIGESGGFTGNNKGYSIDSTGLVRSFEGIITPKVTEKEKGRLSKEQIQKVNGLITELLRAKYSEKGNITSYITLRKDGTATRYSWSGPVPDKNVPEAVSRFYSEINKIIKSL